MRVSVELSGLRLLSFVINKGATPVTPPPHFKVGPTEVGTIHFCHTVVH